MYDNDKPANFDGFEDVAPDVTTDHQVMVGQFMEACGQYDPAAPALDPTNLTEEDAKTARLRLKLTIEEVEELFQAFVTNDIAKKAFAPLFHLINQYITVLEKEDFNIDKVEIADAITDIDYVNAGIGVWLGLPLHECFNKVHANNMTKVDPTTGKVTRNEAGKIMKPAGFQPVNLAEVLAKYNFRDIK